MSETMSLPPLAESPEKRASTVYFIDDSATMREVIKIAFRRENFNVITCADANSAFAQFDQNPPDVVITDVIMPDRDGYSVCSQIKDHPQFCGTPVLLMSGVVNKTVADKAVAVRADELIRKPFQPQELISRVKALLDPKKPAEVAAPSRQEGAAALRGLFAPPPAPVALPLQNTLAAVPPPVGETAWPRALTDAHPSHQGAQAPPAPFAQPPAARPAPSSADFQRLRAEISRLDLLIKKLQTELQIERQYNQALELHVRTLSGID
jgi:CheY-like chemotaxis protein